MKHPLAGVMDEDGMLPEDWPCLRCDAPLGVKSSAERHAGTWNGLCNDCTRAPHFVERTYGLDGARVVSWPPHCPAWRRDREKFIGYEDCQACQGKGVTGKENSHYGRYEYCQDCHKRYRRHPVRTWYWDRERRLFSAAEVRYRARLAQEARVTRRMSQRQADDAIAALPAEAFTRLRVEVVSDYERIRARFRAYANPIMYGQDNGDNGD